MRAIVRSIVGSVAVLAAVLPGAPARAVEFPAASGPSESVAVSADGRFVAFVSSADNLLGGDPLADTNGVTDVFRLDTLTGTVRLVSRALDTGLPANGASSEVDISGDGRFVAFTSSATDLIASDANGTVSDVFRFDADTGAVLLVSRRGASGAQGSGASFDVSISADGTKVAYSSLAKNLVAGDTNNVQDAFVRDLVALTTTRVSTSSNGKQANGATFSTGIAGDGGFVGFDSSASNLVTGDRNGKRDVFLKNLSTGKTLRISLTNAGQEAADASYFSDVSATGRDIVFSSSAANLVSGDDNGVPDVFVRDRIDGTTTRVSRRGATQANGPSGAGVISPDGAYVTFSTSATNLGGTSVDENRGPHGSVRVPTRDGGSASDLGRRHRRLGRRCLVRGDLRFLDGRRVRIDGNRSGGLGYERVHRCVHPVVDHRQRGRLDDPSKRSGIRRLTVNRPRPEGRVAHRLRRSIVRAYRAP